MVRMLRATEDVIVLEHAGKPVRSIGDTFAQSDEQSVR